MKGISTLIATILLVALTVAIAGIIGIFFTGFTTTTTSTVSSSGNATVVCVGTYINLDAANYTTSWVVVTFSNPTRYALSNLTVSVFSGGTLLNSTALTWMGSLAPGAANVTNITGITSKPNEVRVSGLCGGSVPAVGSCFSGQPCAQGTY